MRYNDVYFDFALTPVEAEMLSRELTATLNNMTAEELLWNGDAIRAFRDRVKAFTRKHPCRYGTEALT